MAQLAERASRTREDNEMLDKDMYTHFRRALKAWGMTRVEIDNTLRWATLGPGLAQMTATDPGIPQGLGIVIDEARDADLARLFALRERLDDDEFLAQWESSPASAARVVMDPASPQALLRYTLVIERPERVERRFLFLVHKLAPQLLWLQQPGTQLWLVPQRIAQSAPAGITSAYDIVSRCLPVGMVSAPLAGLDEALAHVGYAEAA
jgi:hypothetical protein